MYDATATHNIAIARKTITRMVGPESLAASVSKTLPAAPALSATASIDKLQSAKSRRSCVGRSSGHWLVRHRLHRLRKYGKNEKRSVNAIQTTTGSMPHLRVATICIRCVLVGTIVPGMHIGDDMGDAFCLDRIDHIQNAIHAEEMWGREAMAGALMGIGKRNKKLSKAAVHAAKAIGPIDIDYGDDNSCEPLDVLKHLTSDYLKKKLEGGSGAQSISI